MAEVFTFIPSTRTTGQVTFRTRVAQFGDGYAQRVGDGINTKKTSWPLEFIGTKEEIALIKAFLDDKAGNIPFLWTAPFESQREFVTPEGYSITPLGGCTYSLSTTFVENNPV